MANSVDLDEVAHYEPPHQDLCCLQIKLLSSQMLKELRYFSMCCMLLDLIKTAPCRTGLCQSPLYL